MNPTIVALFNNCEDAERAVNAAFDEGFDRDSISMVATPHTGRESAQANERHQIIPASGAAAGGMDRTALGLTPLAIPGAGVLVAAGPLAAAWSATGAAAAAGGLAALLAGLGLAKDDARHYAKGVYDGGAVVVVHAAKPGAERAQSTLRKFGPASLSVQVAGRPTVTHPEIAERAGGDGLTFEALSEESHKTETGPEYIAPDNPGYSSSFDEFAGAFLRRDSAFLGRRGEDYQTCKRAYDFGYQMATNRRFTGRDWVDAEAELQTEWTRSNGDWSVAREAIQQGWKSARGLG